MLWHIQKKVGKGKKAHYVTIESIEHQQIAEQVWMRRYFSEGRLQSEDGKITMSVPGAGTNEVERE